MNIVSKFIPHEKDKQRQREKNACIDRKLYRRKKDLWKGKVVDLDINGFQEQVQNAFEENKTDYA